MGIERSKNRKKGKKNKRKWMRCLRVGSERLEGFSTDFFIGESVLEVKRLLSLTIYLKYLSM